MAQHNVIDERKLNALKVLANQSAQNAYAPYSRYKVGAAVLVEDGRIYGGCNIENAAYPSGVCAERVAIFKAVEAGHRKIIALAVSTANGGSPCGACRQVMREFLDDDTPIFILNGVGELVEEMKFSDLLPRSFGPEDLQISA